MFTYPPSSLLLSVGSWASRGCIGSYSGGGSLKSATCSRPPCSFQLSTCSSQIHLSVSLSACLSDLGCHIGAYPGGGGSILYSTAWFCPLVWANDRWHPCPCGVEFTDIQYLELMRCAPGYSRRPWLGFLGPVDNSKTVFIIDQVWAQLTWNWYPMYMLFGYWEYGLDQADNRPGDAQLPRQCWL